MSSDKEHIEEKKKKKGFVPFLSRLFKLTLKIFVGFLLFIVLLMVSIYVLFQFEGFRSWLSEQVSSFASGQLEANLEFEDIGINIFEGIGLENVRLIAAGDTLAQMDQLYLTFQIKPFLDNHVLVTNLTLEKPIIKLLRNSDTSWNFDHIVKSGEEDTTSSEPQNWTIEIQNLELRNAVFVMYDSTSVRSESNSIIDFGNLYVNRLNLKLSAIIETLGPDISVNIDNLSLIEKKTFFNLRSLSLQASANQDRAIVENLEIETDKSIFSIEAALDSVNVFDIKDIGEAVVSLHLEGEKIKMQDIYHFANIDYPLSEEAVVDLEVGGKISELDINKLNLTTGNTWLNLSGKFYNLDNTENLFYDLEIKDSRVYYDDLLHNLQAETRESIKDFDYADMKSLKAKGSDSFVETRMNIINQYGRVNGNAKIKFKDGLEYSADITTENMNPAGFTGNSELEGNINANININGSGTSLEDIKAEIEIMAHSTTFNDYSIKTLEMKAIAYGDSTFLLDTVFIELEKNIHENFEDIFSDMKPQIALSGAIDLSESLPKYDISCQMLNINTEDLFHIDNLPQLFSGSLELNGKGFHLDSLEAEIHTSIDETMFDDRSIMPFEINLTFRRDSGDYKELLVQSDLFSVFLNGDFSYMNFISLLSMQGVYFEQFVSNKINSFYQYSTIDTITILEKIGGFEPVNLSIEAKLLDISPISPLLGNTEIYANASFDIDLDVSPAKSNLLINSINISTLQIKNPESMIYIRPLQISGALFMSVEDSLPKLKKLALDLNSDYDVGINNLSIGNPKANVTYLDSTAIIELSATINDLISFKTNGNIEFLPDKFFVNFDSMEVALQDLATWRNTKPILADITYSEYILNQLTMQRDSSEIINAKGSFKNDSLIDFSVVLEDFPFSDINQFIPDSPQDIFNEISTELDSLELLVKGTLSKPEIQLMFKTDVINIRKNSIGHLFGEFKHKDAKVTGSVGVYKKQYMQTKKFFEVKINSLPLDLYMSGLGERFHSRYPIDINTFAERFPILLLEPFVSGVNNLNGFIDLKADAEGKSIDDVQIEGNLKIHEKSSFVLDPTNLKYFIDGNIEFNQNKVKIDKLVLKNTKSDYNSGKAEIQGELVFDKFDFKEFDIGFQTNGMQVLGEASKKSLKAIYGALIVSTGNEPIRAYGSLDRPNIQGNLNVIRGNLTLPQTQSVNQIESNVKYEIKGNKIIVNVIDKDLLENAFNGDSKENHPDPSNSNSFINKLNIDLFASILGRFVITMDLGLLGQLYAEIGMSDKTVPLHFVMDRNRNAPQISGELKLGDGSRLNYLKLFKTTGTIAFPTGEVDNPNLDLTAIYNGKTFVDDESKDFAVNLYIKGTKDRLDFSFNYSIEGEPAIGDSSEISQDAILLLLTGKTTAGWRSGGSNQTDVVSGSLISSAASPLLSQAATGLLQGMVGIENAEIDLSTGWDNARMQLTGRLAGDVVWRFGGTIADFTQNNEVTIDIPLPLVIHKDYLNNIILQLTQSTNVSQTATRNQKKWEVKLKFGGSW